MTGQSLNSLETPIRLMARRGGSKAAGELLARNVVALSLVPVGRAVALGKWLEILLLRLSGRRSRAAVTVS